MYPDREQKHNQVYVDKAVKYDFVPIFQYFTAINDIDNVMHCYKYNMWEPGSPGFRGRLCLILRFKL